MVVWRSLTDLGLSEKTIQEEDIRFIQFGGLYPKSKAHFALLLWNSCIANIFMGLMIVKCFMHGDTIYALETSHLLLIVINMQLQFLVFHYYSDITTKLYRSINEHFYSYGDTMDLKSEMCIQQAAEAKNRRKKILGEMFKLIVVIASVGLQLRRPLLYLYNGHGKEEDGDGSNWIIYESPTGLYVPYSDHWVPYILGMLQSYSIVICLTFMAASTISCFLRSAEELLHQLYIIKLGLRNATKRADHLYSLKFGKKKSSLQNDPDYYNCLKQCLDMSVKHHQMIIELFEDVKRLMYIPLFTVIFDGGALICIATLVAMTTESVTVRMTTFPLMIGEFYYTYVYCSYGDRLTQAFAEIGDQLYLDNFLEQSHFMKTYLIIIHTYSLRPKKLSAAGFASLNLQSFGNVLRTAYSLMNFLLTQK